MTIWGDKTKAREQKDLDIAHTDGINTALLVMSGNYSKKLSTIEKAMKKIANTDL